MPRPSDDAGEHRTEPARDDPAHQVATLGAQRHAQTHLVAPLRHRVRQHAVDAHRREQQREGGEGAGELRLQTVRRQIVVDVVGHDPHLRDRLRGIDRPDRRADTREQRHRVRRGAHREVLGLHEGNRLRAQVVRHVALGTDLRPRAPLDGGPSPVRPRASTGRSAQLRNRRSSGSSAGQKRSAMVWLITAAGSLPSRSPSSSRRPASSVVPIAER